MTLYDIIATPSDLVASCAREKSTELRRRIVRSQARRNGLVLRVSRKHRSHIKSRVRDTPLAVRAFSVEGLVREKKILRAHALLS